MYDSYFLALYDSNSIHFVVEMENAGVPLEACNNLTPAVCKSILLQLIHALLLAERELEFEHRDL